MIKDGKKFHNRDSRCTLTEIFNQSNSNLDFLSLAELRLQSARSMTLGYKNEECLIFNLGATVRCSVDGRSYVLAPRDVLYIPVGASFHVEHSDGDDATAAGFLYIYRALGEDVHPVFHSKWTEMKADKKRLRLLHRKEVYLMFDVSEDANKFMAGYTYYQDRTRAWPPHNHRDQEECYSFIEGSGAMQVYEDDENLSFVKGVETGDHITIPLLNYHPVFSHEEPLCFIWCIAGNRYWVGDKNKDFMQGKSEKITT